MVTIDYVLPPELEAGEPPEVRGLTRDQVRLMVSYTTDNRVIHTHFRDLGQFLAAGDLVVINTSGTLNAALNAVDSAGNRYELHLSTRLPGGLWIVELRLPGAEGTWPFYEAQPAMRLRLPGDGTAILHAPYRPETSEFGTEVSGSEASGPGTSVRTRLWVASLQLPCPWETYLAQHGFPIRYGYVRDPYPLEAYQTVYATEPGSAEMPSAGRAFTPELITQLVAHGVQFAPLLLHTGVASLEDHEPPYEEYYRVPPATARLVNAAHEAGKRILAVGTTVVRALETVTDEGGVTHPGEGWTRLVITPERGLRAVNAMLTGLHEPKATHLLMLEALTRQEPGHTSCRCLTDPAAIRSCLALAGSEHLRIAYHEALQQRYLWHEFGDLHLILQ